MNRFILVSVLLTAMTAHAQISALEGEWVSISPQTRGITRVLISSAADGTSIEAWGKCHPDDCEWGQVALTPIGKSVEDASFKAGYAVWEPGFASKHVMVSLDRRMLRVETVTVFRDRSRRSSYRIVEFLRRADEAMP